MTATDERAGLEVGALVARLARAEHERDQLRAALLDASVAADRASAARLGYWTDGYRAGFEAGRQVGYGQAVHEWKITARNVGWYDVSQHGPAWAELDRRRYPPGGRLSWIIPRPTDLGTLYDDWASYDGGRKGD